MISRLLKNFLKATSGQNGLLNKKAMSFSWRGALVSSFGTAALRTPGCSPGMTILSATKAETTDDAVLDAWRQELGASTKQNDKGADLQFLLLKNFLYWGSVALSLYLIFTVFSFF